MKNQLALFEPNLLETELVAVLEQLPSEQREVAAQVQDHRESTDRHYQLTNRPSELGWPHALIEVIDRDLGASGGATTHREGFGQLISMVALGGVGIVFGLEVSRLARNNRDWYQLLDLCSVTDTLIGDSDGVYHPALPQVGATTGVYVRQGTTCQLPRGV